MTTPIEQMSFKPGRPSGKISVSAPVYPADVTTTAAALAPWTSQVVNVKDYGALGDGATNDAAAIQAAFNDAFGMAQFTGVVGSGGSDNVLTATSIVGTIHVGGYLSYNTAGAGHGSVQITSSLGGGQYQLSSHIGPVTLRAMMSCQNQGDFNYPVRKVFIPAGNYRVDSPLYILGVLGAHVYGAGNGPTQLFFEGSATQGNILSDAGFTPNSKWTPIIALDGVAYSKFEQFSLGTFASNSEVGNVDNTTSDPAMTGILVYQSSTLGTTSAIMFENLNISNMFCGIAGVGGGGNVENCIVNNVAFNTCGGWGLSLTGQNVLNWQVYGGGASGCGWLSTFDPVTTTGNPGAAYNIASGALGCIYGISTTGNMWDVFSFNGQQCHVAGGSSEGAQNYNGTLTWSAGVATITVAHKLKFNQPIAIINAYANNGAGPAVPGYVGRFAGTVIDANHITYPLASNPGGAGIITGMVLSLNTGTIGCLGGTISIDGFAFRGGSSLYVMPLYVSGYVVVNGCNINCGNNAGAGIISWMVNGTLFITGGIIAAYESSSFKSSGNSALHLQGIQWIGRPPAPYSLFSGGRVREDDYWLDTTVSALPSATAVLTGLRGSVTDGDSGLAWGATVVNSGSGATFYQVMCDGVHWTVTGK